MPDSWSSAPAISRLPLRVTAHTRIECPPLLLNRMSVPPPPGADCTIVVRPVSVASTT